MDQLPDTKETSPDQNERPEPKQQAERSRLANVLAIMALISMPVCAALAVVVVPRFLVLFGGKDVMLPPVTLYITSTEFRYAVIYCAVVNTVVLVLLSRLRMKRVLFAASLVSFIMSVCILTMIFAGLVMATAVMCQTTPDQNLIR